MIERYVPEWYHKKRKSTHSKSGCSRKRCFAPKSAASPVDQTREAFLFSLISLVEKVQQRNYQHAERYQQADHSQHNHKGFIDCHTRHLPSYGFRQAGTLVSGGYHPVMGTFPHGCPCPYRLTFSHIFFNEFLI